MASKKEARKEASKEASKEGSKEVFVHKDINTMIKNTSFKKHCIFDIKYQRRGLKLTINNCGKKTPW